MSTENLQAFVAQLPESQRPAFMAAHDEIRAAIDKWPGVGLIALTYISAQEAAKIPADAPTSGSPP
jgi:hypothetical protein